jgi:hypothetical protein
MLTVLSTRASGTSTPSTHVLSTATALNLKDLPLAVRAVRAVVVSGLHRRHLPSLKAAPRSYRPQPLLVNPPPRSQMHARRTCAVTTAAGAADGVAIWTSVSQAVGQHSQRSGWASAIQQRGKVLWFIRLNVFVCSTCAATNVTFRADGVVSKQHASMVARRRHPRLTWALGADARTRSL